jgi:hypothetical protein
MRQFIMSLASVVAVFALTLSGAVAQTAPNQPGAPPGLADPGLRVAPPPVASMPPMEQFIDGPVKGVDSGEKTVRVGWFFGLLSTTLEVTDDTHIAIDGATGSLDMIREGDRVEATYEAKDGKNVARAIDVTHAESAARPSGAPTQATAPIPGVPQRSADQSSGGGPKTP